MRNDYDLILCDNEMQMAGSSLAEYCQNLADKLTLFQSYINSTTENAIMEGEVHDSLVGFSEEILVVIEVCEKLKSMSTTLVSKYIKDFDSADDHIYETGVSLVRNFSRDEQEKLYKCLENPWAPFWDKLVGTLYNIIAKALKYLSNLINVDSLKQELEKHKKAVLEYNRIEKERLDDIIEAVYIVDYKYADSSKGVTPNGNQGVGSFNDLLTLFTDISSYIEQLSVYMDPAKGLYTSTHINEVIGDFNSQMIDDCEDINTIIDKGTELTIPELEEFVVQEMRSPTGSGVFDNSYIISFAASLGFAEGFELFFFKFFDQLKNASHLDKNYQVRLELKSILESTFADGSYYDKTSKEERSDLKKSLKTIFDNWQGSVEDTYEYLNHHKDEKGKLLLDGRTKEAKELKKYIESIGDVSKFIQIEQDSLDLLVRMFFDYDKGLEMIDSFERNCTDGDAAEAISRIKAEYNKEFEGIAKEVYDTAVGYGVDAAKSYLKKKIPKVGGILKAESVIEEFGKYTGLGDKAEGIYNLCACSSVSEGTLRAYKNAIRKLSESDLPHDSDGYLQLVKDAENCFEMNKKAMADTYKAMAAASSGSDRAYYLYYSDYLNKVTIKNSGDLIHMSKDDYVARHST